MKIASLLMVLLVQAPALAGGPTDADVRELTKAGLPATVIATNFQKVTRDFATFRADGTPFGATTWRLVRGTGNCCENHLTATETGRLLDFGGGYINFTDDHGLTWKQVRPIEPLVGAEGTIAVAPGGDILGVTWDPYTGDRVLAFKMEADTGAWSYLQNQLHTPFYDREWIAVIPGALRPSKLKPIPYATVLRGGWPSKDVWYYSLDGLTYSVATNKQVAAGAAGGVSKWIPARPDPDADWTQPISETSVAPLNGGGALARRADLLDLFGPGWWIMEPGTFRWHPFTLGDGSTLPTGRLVQDSRGWLHLVEVSGGTVTYRLSSDGARSWETREAALPAGYTVEDWDFRANGQLGMTVVGVHAHKDTGTDQDLVVRFSTACGMPEHTVTQLVGMGNVNASSGLGASIRFDFATVALLPDGRVATSFLDSSYTSPGLAIELETTPDDPEEEPPGPSC